MGCPKTKEVLILRTISLILIAPAHHATTLQKQQVGSTSHVPQKSYM